MRRDFWAQTSDYIVQKSAVPPHLKLFVGTTLFTQTQPQNPFTFPILHGFEVPCSQYAAYFHRLSQLQLPALCLALTSWGHGDLATLYIAHATAHTSPAQAVMGVSHLRYALNQSLRCASPQVLSVYDTVRAAGWCADNRRTVMWWSVCPPHLTYHVILLTHLSVIWSSPDRTFCTGSREDLSGQGSGSQSDQLGGHIGVSAVS